MQLIKCSNYRSGAVAGIVSMLLLLTACTEKPQLPANQQAEVGVATVQSEILPMSNELSGRTRAYQVSEVRPQVGGILRKRLFTEGSKVEAGDVLYEIDSASYQASYDSAKGTLAQAQADLLSAKPKAARTRRLSAMDAASKQDSDDAAATLKKAEATVAVAKADLEQAQINLQYTKIRAPISGIIGTSSYTAGALLTADQTTALTKINQLDPMYVDVTQSSASLLHLRNLVKNGSLKSVDGKVPVSLLLEDGSEYHHPGTLEMVASEVDEETGTVKLRAVIPNPDGDLLPGMYVKARLAMAINEKALLVPQKAVIRNTKGEATAWVVDATGKVEQRMLQLGQAVGDRWVVTSGIKDGEQVIVEGTQKGQKRRSR
ncbi:acriflavine resistance protein A [Advenella mimigardefordensis DPN7]|uniref:Acriflavine resistance protein A n=2 Tax=Advenella mimigardefordensis TaxID=302406 RepID=W0PDC9_ADVMD|nr:acriflavine resistance protein A [Advenella mimigardefordensis DPN7]